MQCDCYPLYFCSANILIATPGRLADLFSHHSTLKLAAYVKTLVCSDC